MIQDDSNFLLVVSRLSVWDSLFDDEEIDSDKIQLIPADMRLRISIPDCDFRITNLDSVNLCTNMENSKEMWKAEISMAMFLCG